MHATRIVTFLLGGWIFCTLGVDAAAYLNLKLPQVVMADPLQPTQKHYADFAAADEALLLRHFAAEGNRFFFAHWERVELVLGLALIPLAYIATDRKLIPTLLASFLLIIVAFQYFAVTPELAFRGREADFPPGRGNFRVEQRVWLLEEIYVGTESALVVVAGVLTFYVASYKSRRRFRAGDPVVPLEDIARRRA